MLLVSRAFEFVGGAFSNRVNESSRANDTLALDYCVYSGRIFAESNLRVQYKDRGTH